MVSVILRASLVVKKLIVTSNLLEKRTSKASWVVALFNSYGLLAGGVFVR